MNKINSLFLISGLIIGTISTQGQAASVVFYNKTQIDSTVRVTSGGSFSGICATNAPNGTNNWVPAGGSKTFKWIEISTLCSYSYPCSADLYLSPNHDCQGELIGRISLSSNGDIAILANLGTYKFVPGKYSLSIESI